VEHITSTLSRAPLFARAAIDDPVGKHDASITVLRARYARLGHSLTALEDGSFLVAGHGREHRLRHLRAVRYAINALELGR
jgi:hypothetical protein